MVHLTILSVTPTVCQMFYFKVNVAVVCYYPPRFSTNVESRMKFFGYVKLKLKKKVTFKIWTDADVDTGTYLLTYSMEQGPS